MRPQSPPRVIEGRHHPMIKELRRIVRSGELISDGLVLLESPRMIREALQARLSIPKVIFSAAGGNARDSLPPIARETEVYEVEPELFESLVSTETSQGVIAF